MLAARTWKSCLFTWYNQTTDNQVGTRSRYNAQSQYPTTHLHQLSPTYKKGLQPPHAVPRDVAYFSYFFDVIKYLAMHM